MYRVVLQRCENVESGSLCAQREPSGAREQVYRNRPAACWDVGSRATHRDVERIVQRRRQPRLGVRASILSGPAIPAYSDAVADTRTPEQRSRIMASVKGKNTGPELALRRALYAAGVRGWRCHYRQAPGTPDIAWPRRRVAVFVDGAFWHGHPSRHRPGRSGSYWDEKIERNVERDRSVDAELKVRGWAVVRVWDFEVKRDLVGTVAKVQAVLADT